MKQIKKILIAGIIILTAATGSMGNTAPVAEAGANQSVATAATVTLDGSGSFDADGDALIYRWKFISKPAESSASLSDNTAVSPTFTTDVKGKYVLALVVHDGTVKSDPDGVIIMATNTAPVAEAGANQSVDTLETVTLDGSGSFDANGDALIYRWKFISKPAESSASLSSATAESPTFTADVEGRYVVGLVVHDGTVKSNVDGVIIMATTPLSASDFNMTLDVNESTAIGEWKVLSFVSNGDATAMVSTQGNYGTFVVTDDSLSYLKTTETNETDTGVLEISDGEGTIEITVTIYSLYWKQVSAGGAHTVAIKSDGTLWAWGANIYGQVGDGTTTDKSVPTQEDTNAADWSRVNAGAFHTTAIKSDGTLWAWGYNIFGQLGDGTMTDKSVPTQEGTYAADWSSVSAGTFHTTAIKSDGTLWAWGWNWYGQLGDGTWTDKSVPTQEDTNAADWSIVSAGGYHTTANKSDGTLWAWGDNGYGQLGDGTTTDRSVPTQEDTNAADWSRVNAGYYHSTAIKSDGTLWAWGSNGYGQLGDGTTTDRSVPTQEDTNATDWSSVGAGYWGDNRYGQLGDGTTTDKSVPTQEDTNATDWSSVGAGYNHTTAIKLNSTLWAWGDKRQP